MIDVDSTHASLTRGEFDEPPMWSFTPCYFIFPEHWVIISLIYFTENETISIKIESFSSELFHTTSERILLCSFNLWELRTGFEWQFIVFLSDIIVKSAHCHWLHLTRLLWLLPVLTERVLSLCWRLIAVKNTNMTKLIYRIESVQSYYWDWRYMGQGTQGVILDLCNESYIYMHWVLTCKAAKNAQFVCTGTKYREYRPSNSSSYNWVEGVQVNQWEGDKKYKDH